jgi:hypothetical protein
MTQRLKELVEQYRQSDNAELRKVIAVEGFALFVEDQNKSKERVVSIANRFDDVICPGCNDIVAKGSSCKWIPGGGGSWHPSCFERRA